MDSIDDLAPTSHWDCDETAGIRYDSNDVSNNDLADINTVLYATGKLNNACDFESANSEYLSISDASQTGLEDSTFTISFWWDPESLTNGSMFFRKYSTGQESYLMEYNLTGVNVTPRFQYHDGTSYRDAIATTFFTVTVGNWYHIAVSFDAGSVIYYVNGAKLGNTVTAGGTAIKNSASTFYFGSDNGTGAYLDGLVDEITYFGTVLSSSTVATIYNSGTPLPYSNPATSSPTSTTATSTSSIEDDNIVFMLAVIVFLLAFMWIGFIFNGFRKTK